MFAQKLDFIMNLTNSHNIDLARATGLDASAVSRLRTGKRTPPRGRGFYPTMSEYFATRLTDEHQKKTLADAVCPGEPWPDCSGRAAELIFKWFSLDKESNSDSVELLLQSFSKLSFPVLPTVVPSSLSATETPQQQLFFGLAGIGQGVLALFDLSIAAGGARDIYIFSDETFHWLSISEQSLQSFGARLKLLISIGCSIKIIHNTAKPLPELFSAFSNWLPLYVTGAVEPYYYPRVRDCLHRRTLVVADGLAAMHAVSVEGIGDDTMVHFLTEPSGIQSLKNEFFSFMKYCKPMLQAVCSSELYYKRLLEHEYTAGDYYLAGTTPSLFTMPARVAERISYRSGDDRLFELYTWLRETATAHTGAKKMLELICIPTEQQIKSDTIPVAVSQPLGIPGCYYTACEYAAHLRALAEYAREHRGYSFALNDSMPRNTVIYCKEGEWVILSKAERPCVSFVIEQPTIVNAICAYIKQLAANARANFNSSCNLPELLKRLSD